MSVLISANFIANPCQAEPLPSAYATLTGARPEHGRRGGSCSRCTGPSLFLPLRRFSSLALVFLCVRAHFLPFACAAVPSLQCVEFLLTSMYSNLSVEKKTGNIHGGVPSFPHLIL